MKLIGIVVLVLLLLGFGPILVIWSMNTIFGLTIPTNLATWFATLVLCSVVGGNKK